MEMIVQIMKVMKLEHLGLKKKTNELFLLIGW